MGQPEMMRGDSVPEIGAHETPEAVTRLEDHEEKLAGIGTLEGVDEIIRSLNDKIKVHESYRGYADDGSALAAAVDKDLDLLTQHLEDATERRRELLKTIPLADSDLHDELEEPL